MQKVGFNKLYGDGVKKAKELKKRRTAKSQYPKEMGKIVSSYIDAAIPLIDHPSFKRAASKRVIKR